jgi:ATP-dependent Lhr-like helicase
VEELARVLRSLGVLTYVSHSCLSLSERRAAEQAFVEGENCVIVATSTLELGIDVGDLDRVIQIDAPSSVSSFLQRIGRTGWRRGTSRNCLFLETKPQALLQTTALMLLWSEGYVEPIEPPALPCPCISSHSRSRRWRSRSNKSSISATPPRNRPGRSPTARSR